ncbi:MAG: hypothetical protein EHM45_25055 [Desulfobacteraceae bacterium]|nr:MAG: hypothetical protein EHM45_25055 [Desulfobacteraceae bacterium]
MANPDAERREHWLMNRFCEKVAALRDTKSCVANWLDDFRDSFAKIFGADPTRLWDIMAFDAGIYLMLETVGKMEAEHLLPTIGKYAYEQAKHEWDGSDARVMIQREMTFAMNTSLRGILNFFSLEMDGLPLDNEGGRAHCYNELAKLFRMIRLSR